MDVLQLESPSASVQKVKVSTSNKTLFEPLSLGLPDGYFRMPGHHPARVESRGILSFFYFRL